MTDVRITFEDDTIKDFKHIARAGGSYNISVKYEGEFVIIQDEYYNQTAFPAHKIKKVETFNNSRY